MSESVIQTWIFEGKSGVFKYGENNSLGEVDAELNS